MAVASSRLDLPCQSRLDRLSGMSVRPGPRYAAALLLVVLAGGCRRDRIFTEMSDSTFVRTMVALRTLPVGMIADPAARARQRDSILTANGVTAAQVESTAVRLANDPERAAGIWRAIEQPTVSSPP
jgi:hypothetical protein